ncbi:Crp/Fnr family transcriptional regulator [Saccharicrinis fermentans]|uniref:Fumarate and nitrate reduction regulatory protein n=1 Tax=Saccharicrinis fermentans DSM 9555 = JCM 21142 TaxID=869213 RepID=W7Y8F5_9BACT|nr:Crp/Fnr family transcriptional regulator [Saccharicrinis fermentans]GAF04532.1 fumarate and nitrate reduction regulatory protein [Saccharicrinis fermentans DSM 9555 = JCM 21142]
MEKHNQNNTVDLENTSACFQSLEAEDLQIINKNKTQLSFFKDETIFKQGAFATHVLFVNKGLVRIYLQTDTNKQVNIRLAKQGDFLAFSSVFGKNTYLYSAISLKDSTICMIDKEALKKLLIKNPGFAMQINSKNCHNEDRYLNIIHNISHKQMRGKLASALIYLSSNEFKDENVFEYLTRQNIADFASISVESAVKFIKEFEKEGMLKLEGKNIQITNINKLQNIELRG